jgi:hypothetical protein
LRRIFAFRKTNKNKQMKKGNLYKVMAIMLALVFISAMSFAQSDKKELKKSKSMIINVEVDDDGNTTIDTIVMDKHDMDHMIVNVEEIIGENNENLKEITVEIIGNMEEGHDVFMMNLSKKQKELEEAFENLQKELEALDIEKEAQARIDQAMETLEGIDWNAHVVSLENALEDAHHVVCGKGDSESITVFIEDGDTTEVHTKMVFVGDDDGESNGDVERIIMMNAGDKPSGDMHMLMLSTAGEKDIIKANEAGLKIDSDKRLSINKVNVEIENDDAVIGLKTDESGKMKVTVLDDRFRKLEQIKTEEDDGIYEFPINIKEMMKGDSKAKYLLIEQNKKKELMKL